MTSEIDKGRARRTSRALLFNPVDRLYAVREAWSAGRATEFRRAVAEALRTTDDEG